MPLSLKKWGPSIFSALAFVALAFKEIIVDNSVSTEDKYVLAIALVNAIVTWVVPNLSEGLARMTKPITHAALVGLAFFVIAQTGDGVISNAEWIDGAILVLGAAGVLATVGPVWLARGTDVGGGPANANLR